MLFFTHPAPRLPQATEEPAPVRLAQPESPPGREPLRHLVMGSPTGVRAAIHQLHALHYAE